MPEEACEEAVRDIDKSSAQPSPEAQLESLRREEAKIEEERELQVRHQISREIAAIEPAAVPGCGHTHRPRPHSHLAVPLHSATTAGVEDRRRRAG